MSNSKALAAPPPAFAPPGEHERRIWLVNKRQELLVPLHAILELSTLLIRDAGEREQRELRADLEQARTSASGLEALLVDLLDLGRGEIEQAELSRRIRHDVRTPLTHIIGLCELWLEDAEEQLLAAGIVEDLGSILRLGKALLVSINDIVKFGAQASDPDIELPDFDSFGAITNVANIPREPRAECFPGRLLVVDDNAINRDLLCRCLGRMGHDMTAAAGGPEALALLRARPFDLILLDIIMPELSGFQVLERLKADEALRSIPVIVISAYDDIDGVARCIEMGAEDYLGKPFNQVVLRARISACLEKKRRLEEIDRERRRADGLLHVIFPGAVVKELKETDKVRPRRHENVAVLFSDIVGFTPYCDRNAPEQVVAYLQELIEKWEEAAVKYEVQKIKTIGDAFMAASGLLQPTANAVLNCVRCGLDMIAACRQLPTGWDLRVGIHAGAVVAGVIGRRQYLYDLWGDTVNTAARMESSGVPGSVVLSGAAWEAIAHCCRGESRGLATVKGKGPMESIRFVEFLG